MTPTIRALQLEGRVNKKYKESMASELKAAFSPANSKLVDVEEASQFICRCMEATGAPPAHAASLADVLIAGDKRGHYSHGMNRLGMY